MRAAMPSTVKKPTSAPSVIVPSPAQAASTPPTSAIGRVRNTSDGQPPAAERRLEQEQDDQRERGEAVDQQQAPLRRRPLGRLARAARTGSRAGA